MIENYACGYIDQLFILFSGPEKGRLGCMFWGLQSSVHLDGDAALQSSCEDVGGGDDHLHGANVRPVYSQVEGHHPDPLAMGGGEGLDSLVVTEILEVRHRSFVFLLLLQNVNEFCFIMLQAIY